MIVAVLRNVRVPPELGIPAVLVLLVGFFVWIGTSIDAKRAWRPGPAGEARVVDGDTLVVDGVQVDLSGIDAPETDQICQDATGADYPCGEEAAQVLRNFMAGRPVECRQRTIDERLIIECYAGEIDLAGAMLRTGHAITSDRDNCCSKLEYQAWSRGAGLWRGRFVDPADWREGVR